MIRASSVLLTVLLFSTIVNAQPVSDPGERKSYRYIGLQANQLIRQLFNLSSAPIATNPYLLTFTTNNRITGVGFSTGFGYTYNQTQEGDAFSLVNVNTGDFSLRTGIEKKMIIAGRWIWSIGGDLVFHKLKEVTTGANPNTSAVSQESKTFEFGFGPRCTINFAIAERIILGTEASYYLKFGNETHHGFNTAGIPAPSNRTYHTFIPAVPAVLYLMVRF